MKIFIITCKAFFFINLIAAQKPKEVTIKLQYEDVTPRKPLDYTTSMKESVDRLDKIAHEKSKQHLESEGNLSDKLKGEFRKINQKFHQQYLRIIELGEISNINFLEDGQYKACEAYVHEEDGTKQIYNAYPTIITIKNNQAIKIQRWVPNVEKVMENCGFDNPRETFEECAKKYLEETVLIKDTNFVNYKFEKSVITVIEMDTYKKTEFILVDEILKKIGK